MSEIKNPDETAEALAPTSVAFLADAHSSTFLLPETIATLVERKNITQGIVDLSTRAGVCIAMYLSEVGVRFSIFDTDPLEPSQSFKYDPVMLHAKAESIQPLLLDQVATMNQDISLIIIPGSVDGNSHQIDASPETISGEAIDHMHQADRPCLVVLPPEAGLRCIAEERYVRLTVALAS